MNKITFPLIQSDSSPEVADLQDALLELVNREALLTTFPPRMRQQLINELRPERANQNYGTTTSRLLRQFQQEKRLETTGAVDERTADALNALLTEFGLLSEAPRPEQPGFEVRGKVSLADGSPLAGGLVRTYAKELRSETLLGETRTDRRGNYTVRLAQPRQGINLIVRVFDRQNNLLGLSRTIFEAQPVEAVDLHLDSTSAYPTTSYEQLTRVLTPLLAGRPIRELREDEDDDPQGGKHQELSYLAGKIGLEVDNLAQMVAAEKLAASVQVAPEIVYGLLQKGLPADIYALGAQGKASLRETLVQAIDEQLISARVTAQLDQELEKLFARPEIRLLNRPLFLAKPEILFEPLQDQTTLDEQERKLIDATLNREFRTVLVQSAGISSAPLRRALEAAVAGLAYQDFVAADPVAILRETIFPKITGEVHRSEVAEIVQRLERHGQTIGQLLHLERPLQDHPLFVDSISRAKALSFASLAGLTEAAQEALVEAGPEVDDQQIEDLVKRGLASDKQAADLGLVMDLARLTGDNLTFIRNLHASGVTSTREMIRWSRQDWLKHIQAAGSLPPDETPESYADHILFNLERTYPSQILLSRVTDRQQANRIENLAHLRPLFDRCERLIEGRIPATIDWQDIEDAQRQELESHLADVTAFANTFRHLEVPALINDQEKSLVEKETIIKERLGLLDTFSNHNKSVDLRLVDLVSKSENPINWQDIPEAKQPMVRRQLMAFQRTLALAPTTAARERLLGAGLDSSVAISRLSQAQFIKASGLSETLGHEIYNKAAKMASSIAHTAESIRELQFGLVNIGLGNNIVVLPLVNALRDIDGLEALFGSQHGCACEHCSSILGAPAYFVDLMRFIDENITSPVQADKTLFPLHPLNLRRRRSDLFKLPLTCANTHTLIPYLTIVNEVLTAYLEQLPSHRDIFEVLSKDSEKSSFSVPFNLPLAELRLYLGHFGISLHELYQFMDEPPSRIWPARLDLSSQDVKVIANPDAQADVGKRFGSPTSFNSPKFNVLEFLRRVGIERSQLDDLLGIAFNTDLRNIRILKQQEPETAQVKGEYFSGLTAPRLDFIHRFVRLWKKTGWSIRDLDLVLSALKASGQDTAFVNPRGYVHYVPRTGSRITVKLPLLREVWGIKPVGQTNDLHANAVEQVARLVELQQALKLSVEELCALVHQLSVSSGFPKKAADPAQERLMDRLFDVETLFEGKQDFIFHHYSLNKLEPEDAWIDPKTPILLGGLGISETDLLLLFDLLRNAMPFDDQGDTTLNREKLSLLYRHARLSKALQWSIEELIQALALVADPETTYIETLQQIMDLVGFRKWLRSASISVLDLAFLLRGQESHLHTFVATKAEAEALVLDYQARTGQSFPNDLLADIDGIRRDDAITLVKHMVADGLLVAEGDSYRINLATYRLNQSFKSLFEHAQSRAEILARESAIRAKLNEHHPLAEAYAVQSNLDRPTFSQLIRFVAVDFDGTAFLNALTTPFNEEGKPKQEGALEPVLAMLRSLEQVLFLFEKLKFKADDMAFIADHPEIFGIDDPTRLNLEDLRNLVHFRTLLPGSARDKAAAQKLLKDYLTSVQGYARRLQTEDLEGMRFVSVATEPGRLRLTDLRTVLHYRHVLRARVEEAARLDQLTQEFRTSHHFFARSDAVAQVLGTIWKVDASVVTSLIRSLDLPPVAVEAMAYLHQAVTYCLKLGINGYSLKKLVVADTDYDKLCEARDVALGAFSSRYGDEKVRREKLEPYQDRINVIKRDALCDAIMARERTLKFKNHNDIYHFFLLDVEMSGCFRTSRLVCGLSSLQLYVHRVLTNLEQWASGDLNVLQILNDSDSDGHVAQLRQEWEWRKNYRVWEANRKVFLYPENYLEPDLRDNKTPIFKELEDELLQEQITLESAEAAYKKYLAQFAELARLRIAGNYYHEATKTYYFFARTQQDPPQYYYRTWNQRLWSSWEKIELGINADYVSAIIHNGKLFLFWVERKITDNTTVNNGYSVSDIRYFERTFYYSHLNERRKWIASQRLPFPKLPWELSDINNLPEHLNDKKNHKCLTRVYLDNIHGIVNLAIPREYGNNKWIKLSIYDNRLFHTILKVDNEIVSGTNFIRLDRGEEYGDKYCSFYQGKKSYYQGWYLEKYDNIYGYDSETFRPASTKFGKDEFNPDIDAVRNNLGAYIVTLGNQQFLTQWFDLHIKGINIGGLRNLIRLSTSVVDELGETLFDKGLDAFLSLDTQKKQEKDVGVKFYWPWKNTDALRKPKHLDFKGAYGEYYRELFFHVPFLIAHHLNANQKFAEAKWWYERIFDPTASEKPDPEHPNDRNWRYMEFRGLSIDRMKDILTDEAAIEQYENDPFSPHAIARLRISAYQKTIVLKYIDNLLDWGDSLFARDTMESINEATMFYVLASDILGQRPVQFGACDTVAEEDLTYAKIEPNLEEGSDFLITMENWSSSVATSRFALEVQGGGAVGSIAATGSGSPLGAIKPEYRMQSYPAVKQEVRAQQVRGTGILSGGLANISETSESIRDSVKFIPDKPSYRKPVWDILRPITVPTSSKPVFCIPQNVDLLAYWDRVEDRLFKIRNCMNISGVRRQLALFQPPIDPMALVRAKAGGLSLDDILSMLGAQVPPYRFSHLLDKAKQYTQTVQSFGAALLSALEKKDVEELTLLRSVHERNIMKLSREIKKQQLAEAQYQYQALLETRTNVQNRIEHFAGLIDEGLTGWENVQAIAKHTSTGLQIVSSVFFGSAPILYLIPQLGSPFAIKYGGKEMGDSAKAWGMFMDQLSRVAEAISASAGLIATWDRREQEWNQQLTLAQQELKQLEQQILAADVRTLIAEKDLELHEKQMEQADELDAFYKNKFTNLGLYTYLSTNLNRLYREAYNIAHDMARMAEKAYQFERDDSSAFFIAGDNWQYDRAGLLAGERLLLQLQHLEKAYLEKNTREMEITQTFSLAILQAEALLDLRNEGECEFEIPEIAYDLSYPGQYKRIIKSVRLTIPCVTGPHTNIGATLTLKSSQVRRKPAVEQNGMVLLPSQQATSIATSSSMNDSGVFELNFRDERYLPFEGAGAISKWSLSLPTQLRQFDYQTIADVLVHVSYTALYDVNFKDKVENDIVKELSNSDLFRAFSLKHEFPDAFHRLCNQPEQSQSTEFEITSQHFPYFLKDQTLTTENVKVFVLRKEVDPLDLGGMQINEMDITWPDNKPVVNDPQTGTVALTGTPLRKWTIARTQGGLSTETIADIVLLMHYKSS